MSWRHTERGASAASPRAVWDVLLDGRRWSLWNPGVEWLWFEGEAVAGALATIKLTGVRQTALVILEAVPPQRLTLGLTIGPIARFEFSWTLADGPQHDTRIEATATTAGLAAGLLLDRPARRIARAVPAHLERLAARAREEEQKNARLA